MGKTELELMRERNKMAQDLYFEIRGELPGGAKWADTSDEQSEAVRAILNALKNKINPQYIKESVLEICEKQTGDAQQKLSNIIISEPWR